MRRIHQDEATHEQLMLDLDELARQGASLEEITEKSGLDPT